MNTRSDRKNGRVAITKKLTRVRNKRAPRKMIPWSGCKTFLEEGRGYDPGRGIFWPKQNFFTIARALGKKRRKEKTNRRKREKKADFTLRRQGRGGKRQNKDQRHLDAKIPATDGGDKLHRKQMSSMPGEIGGGEYQITKRPTTA